MHLRSFLVSATLLFISQAIPADEKVFLESDGLLIIEAESETAAGQWSLQNEIPGFSGNGYYLWQGPNHFGGPSNNPDDHIEYRFRIQTAGNFQLRWRSRISTGTQATEHNDSWISFPTGDNIQDEEPLHGWTKVYMGQLDTWSWDSYTVDGKAALVRQYFEAGEHRMLISGRSNGHAIDRIALFAYDSVSFSDAQFDALPESPGSDATGASHVQQPDTCFAGEIALRADMSASDTGDRSSLSDELVVSSNSRYGYLTFDLSRVSPAVSGASLALILRNPARSTTLSVYAGCHTDWDRTSNALQMPYPEALLGQSVISGDIDTVQYIQLDKQLLTRGLQSLILTAEESTEELYIATFDISAAPQLRLTGDGALCEFYEHGTGNSNTNEEGSSPAEPETGTDTSAEAGTDTEPEGGTDRDPGTTDQPDSTSDTGFQGESGTSQIPVPIIGAENEMIDGHGAGETISTKRRAGGAVSLWMLLTALAYSLVRKRSRVIPG